MFKTSAFAVLSLFAPSRAFAPPSSPPLWAEWAAEPIDETLLRDVQEIFEPVKNIGHIEGLPENN